MALFPETQLSVIDALDGADASARERARERVVRIYRMPVIELLRRQWQLDLDDAEDLAHDFFARALERDWLTRFDAQKGRFRTFLRVCVRAFVSTAHDAAAAQKRGGHLTSVPLDVAGDLPATNTAADSAFDREWARSILSFALDALRDECLANGRESTFDVFVAYDVAGADAAVAPSYAALAKQFGVPVTQITNYLAWGRQHFREHVLSTVRSLTTSDREFREEVRALLGRDYP